MQFQTQVYITKRFIHQKSTEKLVYDEFYVTIDGLFRETLFKF